MKKFYYFFIVLTILFSQKLYAQNVTVTATLNDPMRDYNTLGEAFQAINNGDHMGDIEIKINASFTEGSAPATLNSSDADPTSYTSIKIFPSADGIIVSGDPGQGFGIIQLNGADNVIIDGDNPNTAGTNRNLTFINTSANTIQFSSVIRIATSTAVLSADNITIRNCIITGNVNNGNVSGFAISSLNSSFGIYSGGKASTSVAGLPEAILSDVGDKAPSGSTINNFIVTNNEISNCGRAVSFLAEATTVNNILTITANIIGGAGTLTSYPYTTPASTVYSRAITIAGTESMAITGNTIRNIMLYGNNNVIGIELQSPIGIGTVDISNNIINGVVNNGTGGSDARGMLINVVGAPYTIKNNTISNIESSALGFTSAIQIGTNIAPGTIEKNKIFNVISRSTGGAIGIYLATAANDMVIQNNFIYDIKNTLGNNSFASNRGVHGILINSGSNHKIYHNSVHLYGVSAATTSNYYACLSVFNAALTGIDIRNNIFANTVTGGSASDAHVALFMPFTAVATMNLTLNNNAYYTGLVAGKSGIAFAGAASYTPAGFFTVANFSSTSTTPSTNWRSFSSALGVTSNDNASVALSTTVPFTSNTDLHIPNGATPTPLESGGAIVGVLTDIDNQVRPGPAGSTQGGGTLPDIGADEFDRQLEDRIAPIISFTPPVVCGTGPRTVVATITDATGVPTAGAGLPRLYYRITTGGPWLGVTGTHSGGSTYTFIVDPGGVATIGQLVEYYIVAQDIVTTPNVTASPSTGAGGYTINPPAASTPPATLYSYVVTSSLTTGIYTVGAGVGRDFPTLTAAVAAYNVSCLDGPVTFNLMDPLYSTSETFPITITANSFANASRILTIKPNTTATISGNNGSALIKFSGADYVVIDGSNNGTSTSDLTISNSNNNNTATVIWMASASLTNGSTFNSVKNTKINGSGSATTLFGIASGSGTTLGNTSDAPNSNNSYTGNTIKSVQNGFWINGKPAAGEADQALLISNNTIGSTVVAEKMGFRGLILQNVQGFTISGNTIQGVAMGSTFISTASGIHIGTNVVNGNIFNNRISDVRQPNTGGYGANGIFLNTATGSAINIYNNFIWEIWSYGGTLVTENSNAWGIMVNAGGGYNIYYNSILMGTSSTATSSTSAAINIGVGVNSVNALNIRNNVFANIQTVGNRYTIYSAAPATVFNTINNNDYYTASGNIGFLGSARPNLTSWRQATGKDGNSIAANPLFVSMSAPVNLHVSNVSPLNALAAVIAGLTTDIDGEVRSSTFPDIGADEFTAPDCNVVTGGTITSSVETICGPGSTASLYSTGYAVAEGLDYQWQYSTVSASGPWLTLSGQTNPTGATTNALNVTTWFQLYVYCDGSGEEAVSNVIQITVNDPKVTSTTPGTRCGTGPVTISATTTSPLIALNWYAAPTGGLPLFTGTSYSPVISATTTFYVSASIGGITETGGKIDATVNSSFHTNTSAWGVVFSANSAFTLNSTVIYPTGSGFISIALVNSSGVELASTPSIAISGSGLSTPVTIPLGFSVPIGTGYRLIKKSSSGITGLVRETGASFPYNSPSNAISVTSSWNGGVTSGTYYWFYSLDISTGCESPRSAVVATSTPAIAITATTSQSTICAGQSATLTAGSANSNYTYQWTPGALNGAVQTVTPPTTTTYTVTATDAGTNCANTKEVTINVNRSPIAPVITANPATPICSGQSTILTATSNAPTALLANYVFDYATGATLDPMAGAATIIASSVDDAPAAAVTIPFNFNFNNTNYNEFSASPDGWIRLGAGTATSQFTNNLTLATNTPKIAAYWDDIATGTTGNVKWLVTGAAGSRIVKIQWLVTVPRATTGAANSTFQMWLYETSNKIEFRYGAMNPSNGTSNISSGLVAAANNFWSVTFATNTASNTVANNSNNSVPPVGTMYIFQPDYANITWSPGTNLSSTTGSPVTANPATTTTYTATATNSLNCSRSTPVTVTVNPSSASVVIAADIAVPICAGSTITFTATPTNGGATPTYQWQVNGGNVGTNSPTYTTTALNNGDLVTVNLGGAPYANCVTGGPFTSNTFTAQVNPVPTGTISGSAAVCANSTGNIYSNTVLPAAGTVTHNWSISAGGTIIGATNGSSVTVTAGAAGSYTITDNFTRNGCAGVASLVVTVNPNFASSVSIAGDNCAGAGNPVTFTATPVNGGGSPVYQWTVNGGNVGTNSPVYIHPSAVVGEQVQVSMTGSLPCTSPATALSNIIVISANSAPTPVITTACATIFNGSGQTPVLDASTSLTGGSAITSYQWNLGGTPIPGATGVTHTATVAGAYTLTLVNASGCSATSGNFNIANGTAALTAGTYIIPGTGCNMFTTVAGAVSYINNYGITGSGGVIFEITPGYNETAPAGGFAITANGTATNQIIFRKGTGAADATFTASAAHTSGTLTDGVFKLIGADYISIRGLKIQENALNTNSTPGTNNMTEFGIALLQGSVTNGAQNDSIAGNTISLNRNYANSFGIYSSAVHSATLVTALSNITSATGSHSSNKFYSNSISNVNQGIALVGSGGSTGNLHDTGNDIGGSGLSTGNTLTNWGGNAPASAFHGLSNTGTFGIQINNQVNENVSYNTLTSASLSGMAGVGVNTRGIWKAYFNAPSTGSTFTSSITNNNITLTGNYTAAGAYEFTAIRNEGITALTAGATININNNSILNTSVAAGGTPTQIVINNSSVPGTLNISNNLIKAYTSSAATGAFTGISSTTGVTNLNINNNQIGDVGADGISNPAGAITLISSLGATNVANKNITGNILRNVSSGSAVIAISSIGGTATCNISNNTINNISGGNGSQGIATSGSGTLATITANTINGFISSSSLTGISLGAVLNNVCDNNTLTNLVITNNANLVGIQLNAIATVSNNNLNNFNANIAISNAANIWGVFNATTGITTISGNTISALTSSAITGNGLASGLVNGIYSGLGSTINISKNRIYELTLSGNSTTAMINGIHINAGTLVNISNNFISDLKNPNGSSADALRGIAFTASTANATYNVYYNTIYLKAVSSQALFGTSGIYHTASGTGTSAVLNLRNNIIVNESSRSGAALTVALRRSVVANANYAVTSNNNLFYAGIPSANNLLYSDGTAAAQNITAMQTAVGGGRESASISTLPLFVNSTAAPFDLHLNTSGNCLLEGKAAPIGGYTDDYDGDGRNATLPDIGADEFNPAGGGPAVWKGVNTDWNDVNNWCPSVPTATTDVTIPNGAAFYPVITTATPVARDIIIGSTANIQIAAAGTLSVNGVFNSAGTITNNGKIVMQGTSNQFFPGITATVAAMNVFEINKPSGNVTIDGNFRLTGEFLPTSGTVTMDGTVTIASTAASTARIGVVGTSNAFIYNGTGSFIVERYINTGIGAGQHAKSWQLLGSPTRTETVNAWQDGNLPMGNLRPGFGTIVTGTAAGQGFDIITPAGSTVKWWNAVPATPLWVDIPNVSVPVYDKRGYMVFVRGDRSVTTSVASPNPTTLRTRGAIFAPGTNAPPSSTVLAGKFESVANPYASAITYTALSLTNVDANKFYVWDPLLAGAYGLGGFQTIQGPTWLPVPGGTTTYPSATPVTTIQSGQAFFVFNSTGTPGTVGFSEAAKTTGSAMVFRGNETIMSLSASLYAGNNMADGNLVVFDQAYADGVDMNDAIKQANFGENFGIVKETRKLSIESRSPVTHTDTVFYNIASLKQQEYLLKFAPANLNTPGLSAYLVDRFTARYTDISLTDSTVVPIAVTAEAGSSAADRFLLVFKKIPSVSFLQLNAVKEGEEVKVSWEVKDEVNIAHYEIERSSNGTDFGKTGEQSAVNTGLASYNKMDRDPLTGDNHYRIRSVSVTGEVRYSNIAKVRFTPAPAAITVHPNPMKEDKLLNISMVNKPAGRYIVRLMTSNGTTVYTDIINHAGRSGNYPIRIRSFLAHGTYILGIGMEEGESETYKIVY